MNNPLNNHFLDDFDIECGKRLEIFETAWRRKYAVQIANEFPLRSKQVALMMMKPSLRTRLSFTVAVRMLGGDVIEIGPQNTKLGQGEEMQEWASVLGRMVDAIVARVDDHEILEQLKLFSGVPVINGLSDQLHPCQGLADAFTVWEHAKLRGDETAKTAKKFYEQEHQWAWLGDGNNVAHSLLLSCASLGVKLKVACPPGHGVNFDVLKRAQKAHRYGDDGIQILTDPNEAVHGASVVCTDTWISMGEEKRKSGSKLSETISVFSNFRVDEERMNKAKPGAIFLHCLPAQPGNEVSEGVLRGPSSRVLEEAENRLWTTSALLSQFAFCSIDQ